MKIAKWDDGYVLDADPRREDPLYYYMREGQWGTCVGFEVAPLYEELDATQVSVRVWPAHLPREAGMDDNERRDMYPRVISILLHRFPKWSCVTLKSSRIPEMTKQGLVSAIFEEAGFSRSINAEGEETWART